MGAAPRATEVRHLAAVTAAERLMLVRVEQDPALWSPGIRALVRDVIDAYASEMHSPTLAPPPALPMPWRLRLPYAWRALTGRIRPVSDIDTSQLDATGWVEGRVRVQVRRPPKE